MKKTKAKPKSRCAACDRQKPLPYVVPWFISQRSAMSGAESEIDVCVCSQCFGTLPDCVPLFDLLNTPWAEILEAAKAAAKKQKRGAKS